MSPIEDALLDEFVAVAEQNGVRLMICAEHDDTPRRELEVPMCRVHCTKGERGTPIILVCRQAFELGYRVDLLLRIGNLGRRIQHGKFDALLAIECDGHDWHERTKQQASHDRARDRELLIRRGLVTIRFTGSDIYRDANQCAQECLEALLAVAALTEKGAG